MTRKRGPDWDEMVMLILFEPSDGYRGWHYLTTKRLRHIRSVIFLPHGLVNERLRAGHELRGRIMGCDWGHMWGVRAKRPTDDLTALQELRRLFPR